MCFKNHQLKKILRNIWSFTYLTFTSSGFTISIMNIKKQQEAYSRNFRYTTVTPLIKVPDL